MHTLADSAKLCTFTVLKCQSVLDVQRPFFKGYIALSPRYRDSRFPPQSVVGLTQIKLYYYYYLLLFFYFSFINCWAYTCIYFEHF